MGLVNRPTAHLRIRYEQDCARAGTVPRDTHWLRHWEKLPLDLIQKPAVIRAEPKPTPEPVAPVDYVAWWRERFDEAELHAMAGAMS